VQPEHTNGIPVNDHSLPYTGGALSSKAVKLISFEGYYCEKV